MSKKGIVYLLGDFEKEGFYKIGVTTGKIENRIKKLQTGNGGEIYLVKYHKSEKPFFIEKYLHKTFFSSNIKNEWFYLTIEDINKFEEYCEKGEKIIQSLKDNVFFNKEYGSLPRNIFRRYLF